MDNKPKNLCLDFPQFNVRKPYHLEIDNDGNILYPEYEKINGINIVKQPKVAFEQLEKMLQGGFKRDELVCVTACQSPLLEEYPSKSLIGLHVMFNALKQSKKIMLVSTELDTENTRLGIDNLIDITRVKSRNNSLDNLNWVSIDSNVKKYKVNGLGDLGMTHKELIGQTVELVKICKSGLYQIKDAIGKLHSIPKRNLKEL